MQLLDKMNHMTEKFSQKALWPVLTRRRTLKVLNVACYAGDSERFGGRVRQEKSVRKWWESHITLHLDQTGLPELHFIGKAGQLWLS